MSIYKACDIRGIHPQEIDEETAFRIGRGLGTLVSLRGRESICAGGDFRKSTPSLKERLVAGLLKNDLPVLDCGQLPTPVVYFAAREYQFPNVCIVTASHNPPQYNGVKFMIAGTPAVPQLVEELRLCTETCEDSGGAPTGPQRGRVVALNPLPACRHAVPRLAREMALRRSDARDRRRSWRVVVDAAHGALSEIGPQALKSAGFDVLTQHCRIDPFFGGLDPNPAKDANLAELCDAVVRENADMGIAFDGDGDRVAFIAANSAIVRPEQVGAMLAEKCYERPLAIYDLKCASVFPRAIKSMKGNAVMQPCGHGFIKAAMLNNAADIGVEISGHYFYKELCGGDDGLFTALLVSHLAANAQVTLSQLIAPYAYPAITPDVRLRFDGDIEELLHRIESACGGCCSYIDGLRADYDDGWALVRASITEPLVTFRFEAYEKSRLFLLIQRFLSGAPEMLLPVIEAVGISMS